MLGPNFGSHITEAKENLAVGRERMRRLHDDGAPGIQVCSYLTDLLDGVVLDLFEAAMDNIGQGPESGLRKRITLVAHGGYGRRDVAPFSDVDLMLLHAPGEEDAVAQLARRFTTDIYDVGLDLGFSVRTPAQAQSLAMADPVIFTSLVESRYVAGSDQLLAGTMRRLRRQAKRRFRTLLTEIERARREERAQYGETVYLLEPNIKRSQGGLRDLQLIRWLGFASCGQSDPKHLQLAGQLSTKDYHSLRAATAFLLRLRNELHFSAEKGHDVLGRTDQIRLAEIAGYQGDAAILPVEQFMRDYFHHTGRVHDIAENFMERHRSRVTFFSAVGQVFSHRVEGDFRVGPKQIATTGRGLEKVTSDVGQVLRMMDLANLYDKRIDVHTWETVREAMLGRELPVLSAEVAKRFVSLLSQPPRLGRLLRQLHELGALEQIVPGYKHARSLLQFNEYHKYTVDEHCIRSVEAAAGFATQDGPIGEAYRQIKQKHVLHLALLIHDLGKGHEEDHSVVGERHAAEVAARLRMSEAEKKRLCLLVRKHLLMSHLAFRRDTADEDTIVNFAVQVGSPDVLRMLYVLTCADLAAVGPDTLTQWKVQVLTEFYQRTLRHLAGDRADLDHAERIERCKSKLPEFIIDPAERPWYVSRLEQLPPAYLFSTTTERVFDELARLKKLPRDKVEAWGRYLPDRQAVEYTITAYEQQHAGIFHRITGALSGRGLEILAAEISTFDDGLVLDRFYVNDPDYTGRPPDERIEQVCQHIVATLGQPLSEPPAFRRVWHEETAQRPAELEIQPNQVQVDNETSDQYTIVDVFAHDRMGLLYTVSRRLFELGADVWFAKIGTYIDQVVDVFYITDAHGNQIDDEQQLDRLRREVLAAIDEVEVGA